MQVGPILSTLLDPTAAKAAPLPDQAPKVPLKAPFDPAPAIRPTIQDTIDVDRTLMALRRV